MKPIDKYREDFLSLENANFILSATEYAEFYSMDESERKAALMDLLEKPISSFTSVNELYFRSKWAALISRIYQHNPITLLEVASGDADMIPQALSRSNPQSQYITANMNVRLNESLLRKAEGLHINLRLIEGDAAQIADFLPSGTVDIAAFQHGVNDVLQAILCEQNGVDTINTDWMECLPKMIALLQTEKKNGTFEQNVKEPFLGLIRTLLSVLKQDGLLAISHYMFQLDLDMGYPPDLFENLIPLVREWFQDLNGCKEVLIDGFEPQWWLFLAHK